MKRPAILKGSQELILFGLVDLLICGCTGCAYFRFGQRPYTEVRQFQQEQEEINRLFFKPGTVFYSR
jgi:hypothetical protein